MAAIIIPAHNEAATVSRCLSSFLDSAPPDLAVYVVCNGCVDDTANVARGFAGVTVIEVAEASKAAALNAGDAAAGANFPRIFADADIVFGPDSVRNLIDVLDVDEVRASAPHLRVDVSGRPLLIRRYYQVFEQTDWATQNMIGSGVYGMSERGRAKFDRFPDIINDDKWINTVFSRDERLSSPGWFQVQAPRTLEALVTSKARAVAGERELRRRFGRSVIAMILRNLRRERIEAAASRWRRMPSSMLCWYLVRGLIRLQDVRRRVGGIDLEWRQDRTIRQ